jgi:hypothetical protein
MGGRMGSTSICQTDKPDELACSVVHALLTVSSSDQLKDMPQRYGFNARDALYFFHQSGRHLTRFASSWDDALETMTPLRVSARTGRVCPIGRKQTVSGRGPSTTVLVTP